MKTILVCGTREAGEEWASTVHAWLKWASFELSRPGHRTDELQLVHGGAHGIDSLAKRWAEAAYWDVREYPADWAKHGNAAGPIRNRAMFVDAKPDLVLAFGPIIKSRGRDGVKLTGTGDMVSVAHEGGCQVILVPKPNVRPRG